MGGPVARRARSTRSTPQTGKILRTIESNRFVTGVTWVDGELWHGTWESEESELRRVDPASGEVLERLDMPAGVGVSGLESDGADQFARRRHERQAARGAPATEGLTNGGRKRQKVKR